MTPRLPDPLRCRAVLVGAGAYAYLPDLPGVAGNLAALHRLLTSPEGLALAEGDCRVLADPESAADVLDAIAAAAGQAEDVLVVYYAGHLLADDGSHYLATAVTETGKAVVTALPCAAVARVVSGSRARVRLVVVDARGTGRALAGDVVECLAVDDVQVLVAVTDTFPVGEGRTAGTGALLAALRDGIPGGGPLLTFRALAERVADELDRVDDPPPAHTARETALVRNRAEEVAGLRSRWTELLDLVDQLAAEEARVADLVAVVADKIAGIACTPGAAVPRASVRLGALLGALDEVADRGRWSEVAARLREVEADADTALTALTEVRAAAQGLLDQREELRGLAEALRAQTVRLDVAEDVEVAGLRKRAHDLLWVKPCDLAAASAAVAAYHRVIVARREGR